MRLAIACLVALSVSCSIAGQTSQYIFGSQAGQPVPTSGQSWTGLVPRNDVDVWASSPATGTSYALMPTTGIFSTFCVNLTTAPGTGAGWTWTLYKNGLDQYLSVNISGTQTQACDLVDTTGFVPGDLVALQVTPTTNPVPASTYASWYILQTPAVPGETILFGSQQLGGPQYLSLAGNSSSLQVEADMATVIPAAGTVTKFIAEYVGGGSSVTATLDQNESPTALVSSLSTSGTYVEQPANLSISAGDALDVNLTGITGTSAVYTSVVFVPDVAGQFVIPTWRNAESDRDPTYYLPLTGRGADTLQPVEALAQQIGGNVQIQGEYIRVNNAPGTGAQFAFTLRDNGANTALSTILSGSNLTACTTSASVSGCASGSVVAVNNFDFLDTMVVATGSPAASPAGVAVSYLAYVPQLAFTAEPPAMGSAGSALSPVVVQLQDQNGNAITGSSAKVTISSSPAGVSGTLTVAAVNGVATFDDLVLNATGPYTLTAAASGLAGVTSSATTIVAGTANMLVFTSAPSTGAAGTALTPVTVRVEDANGNLVNGSSASVTISSTPAGVGGTLTVNAVNGIATFNNLIFTASGSYTLSAASSGLTGATSGLTGITSGSGSNNSSQPTSQFILGAQPSSFVPTTGQNWIGFSPRDEDLWAASATTGTSYALMPTTGTFSSLCVNLTAAPGAGASWIWSLYKNGADQAVTVTISGSETQACDSVDTTGFLPGDLVALHVTPSASPAPADAHASWYIVQTPAVPGETILFASHPTSSSYYFALGANGSGVPSETEATTIIPTAGTITKYIAEYVGPSAPVSSTVDQNESPTSLSASTPTSGTFVEQTGNLSVSTGDVFDVYETGLSSSSAFYASMVFVPSVPGQFVIPSYRNAETQNSATTYFSLTGRSGDAFQPNVSLTQEIGGSMQIQSLFTQTTVAPGSGAEWTYTLSDNDANTSLNTTTSGTNFTSCTTSTPVTGCASGSPVTVNNFDLLSTAATPTNSPAISDDSNGVAVSYLAYTPRLAFSTEPPATDTTGTALSQVVVELQDENGNPLSGSTAQVTISSSPTGVSGTLTVNAVNGVATFNNLVFNATGTYTLLASATGLATLTSTSISISAGSAPAASLTSSLSFPSTPVGTTSAAMAATLSNSGNATLNNIVPTVTGANPSDFAITTGSNACGSTLAAGSSCSIYVTFTPASAATFTATLSVADNASGSPQTSTLSGTGTSSSSTTWPNGYTYQATFTVAAGKVPSAQTSFPALISGTWSDFATTANGGRITNTCNQTVGNNVTSVPCDLIFTSDAAGSQLLSWEYETYTATTGAVNIWVNVPSLANGTVIYAWYGQSSVTTLQTTPSSTWPNYQAVYHMKENPAGTAPQLNDSTGNGNNATMQGTVAAGQQQAGEIDGSINFEGDSYASLASSSTFNFERTNSFSVSGWFKIGANTTGALISKYPDPANAGWALAQLAGASSPQFALGLFGTSGSTGAFADTTSQASMGVWHYVVATYSGTSTVAGMNIYVDGVNQALTTKENNLTTSILNSDAPAINSRVGTVAQESDDVMDELRVSASGVVLTQAWVTASYNNQSSPSTFFGVTTGLTNSSTGPAASLTSSLSFPNTPVGTTSAALAATLSNTGNATLNNIVPSITGANPSDFAITTGSNACGSTLAAGSNCSIYVTFTPASASSFTATLSVADNASGSPQTSSLTGTGTAPAASLTSSLSFPSTTVGTTSAAMAATLSNSGNATLNNIAPSITGANPSDFAITTGSNACGSTLAAGSSCSIYVTFTPASASSFSATLSVADSASGSPQMSALTGTGTTSAPTTWPNGYTYQATLTVAAGKVPSAQTSFPALISGTWSDFATTANGGRITNTCNQTVGNNVTSVPCDLIFTSDAAGSQLLSWEFETYTAATGAVNIWVNVPSLANGTVIYAWYGQPSVTTLQTTPSSTWPNYQAVYHMKENPAGTAPQLNDSTGNGNNATMQGTVAASQQQAGEIDGSINFEGDSYASLASSSTFNFERTNSFSISGWFKIGSNIQGALIGKFPNPVSAGWQMAQQAGASSPQISLALWGTGGSTAAFAETTSQVSMNVWHNVVVTYSGTGNTAGMNIYVDGVNQALTVKENTLNTSILNSDAPAINSRSGTPTAESNDVMDELRVSASGVVLTQAWVAASYNNQSSPGTFFTVATGLTN